MSAGVHFPMDDPDLDDAELWAAIESAASSRSRKPLLPLGLIEGSKPFRNPRPIRRAEESSIVPVDGEVVEEDLWDHRRPQKMPRFMESSAVEERTMVVVRHPQRTPMMAVSSPTFASPDPSKYVKKAMIPVVESPPPEGWNCVERENREPNVGLHVPFPSVSSFKKYQNSAMAILEKTDYTVIQGHPFIKKSGWRKISFFFNLSFEIRDKSIEFDENRNVQRAEFIVRAYMKCGRFADGWGSCERREKKFMKPNHDIPSTAETRAKNKACQDLLGIGEYRPGVENGIR
ncbi:uncharacterized protein LOC121999830 [Zingiber officinale]|uniref:Uncharacterized protein n=1 Tax=Zingiber officinale TaxID=94328 RepID=A0A8J5FQ94_ZINOF|nr:uncharacterized protein LOC121999830 [Zingiber officinale]KAG6491595.1 hypothetical protein ZIOFF_046527 [Zingiber officinale]